MEVLFSVFLMGLLGGVHCFGMCGGIVAMLTAAIPEKQRSSLKNSSRFHLSYNLGRILSYIVMGALFGGMGYLFRSQLSVNSMDMVIRVLPAVLMIVVGLYILNINLGIRRLEYLGSKLWEKIQPLSKRFLPIKNLKSAFYFGLLWGGIPCGLVYSALALSLLSGSAYEGGLIMLSFGLGTLPALLVMSGFSSKLSSLFYKPMIRKFSGILIISLGIWSILMPFSQSKEHHLMMESHDHSHEQSDNFPIPNDFDYFV
ncbi:MAG: sulfite exporter TauE/SafE family protein [Gammaproteobacteria bacterium]